MSQDKILIQTPAKINLFLKVLNKRKDGYHNIISGVTFVNLFDEIKSLNDRVTNYSTENITSNLQQYLGYIKDIEKLPTPMDRPVYHNKNNFTYNISNLL